MVRINYANPDMVGHTGDLAATIKSCEVVDACVKELLEVADSVNARCGTQSRSNMQNMHQ